MKSKKALYTGRTTLMAADNISKSCLVSVMSDRLLIEIAGQPNIVIYFEHLTQVLFDDRSYAEVRLAGLCLEYKDHTTEPEYWCSPVGKGPGRLLFLTTGWFPVSNTKKLVRAIKDAYSTHYTGTSISDLTVIDVSEVKRISGFAEKLSGDLHDPRSNNQPNGIPLD